MYRDILDSKTIIVTGRTDSFGKCFAKCILENIVSKDYHLF